MITKELYLDAIEIFGQDVVNTVISTVSVSDPDGCYTMFEDLGYYEHAECVDYLYFN